MSTAFCKSSHRKCSIKESVLKNFAEFTGKTLCHSLFFNKVAGFTRSLNVYSFLSTACLYKRDDHSLFCYLSSREGHDGDTKMTYDFKILNCGGSFFELINPFVPNAPFLYSLKTRCRERVHWEQMS